MYNTEFRILIIICLFALVFSLQSKLIISAPPWLLVCHHWISWWRLMQTNTESSWRQRGNCCCEVLGNEKKIMFSNFDKWISPLGWSDNEDSYVVSFHLRVKHCEKLLENLAFCHNSNSSHLIFCVAITCGNPGEILNGYYKAPNKTVGNRITFYCDFGWVFNIKINE